MSDQSSKPTRRRILQVLFGGSIAALTGAGAYVAGKFLAPIAGEIASVAAGHVGDLSGDASKAIKVGLKDVLLLNSSGTLTAFDLKCSHAGCTVHWANDDHVFRCPCHGGVYGPDGKVVSGPPPRPLARLRVSIATDGAITVTDLPA